MPSSHAVANLIRPSLGPEPPAGVCGRCGGRVVPVPGWREWLVPELCPSCAGAVEARQEAVARESRIEELIERSNLPPLARQWHFRRAAEEANPDAFRAVYAWSHGPEGLYLWGPVGTGKTVLAWCLLLREIRKRGRVCLALHVPSFLGELRRGFGERSAGRDLADRARSAAVLLLDDLGAEKPSEWAREVLLSLVDHRVTHEAPVVVTSNCDPAGLHAHLGSDAGRLVDRLVGSCRLVEVGGDSFRQRVARQRLLFAEGR